jgi:hypothetical protein
MWSETDAAQDEAEIFLDELVALFKKYRVCIRCQLLPLKGGA